MTDEKDLIIEWLLWGNVSMSTRFMILVHLGLPSPTACYPSDKESFAKCLDLVEKVPVIKSSFHKLAKIGPRWKAIIEKWDKLELACNTMTSQEFEAVISAVLGFARMWQKGELERVEKFLYGEVE